jgi:flagellar hook assembly protein FlgD
MSMNEFVPSEFYLGQNYPNPFKQKTTIKYCVAYKTRVQLTVYNSNGETIEKIVDEQKEAGTYEIVFDASTCHSGKVRNLAGGKYKYLLVAGYYSNEKTMVLENDLL